MPLSSLYDKRNDTSQLQVKNEFISCRLFHFSFFKNNRYIHFCKKWRIASYDHILIYGYVYLIIYLRIFYKINVSNEPLHDHYFLSFSYLMKSSCWRKEHTTSGPSYHRIKIVPSNNESVLNLSIIIIYFYTDKFFKSFTSNVECFRFILGKKARGRAIPNRSYPGRQ